MDVNNRTADDKGALLDDEDDVGSSLSVTSTCGIADRALNAVNHLLGFGIAGYVCWLAFNYTKFDLVEWHVVMATLGYQLFMSQAVLSLSANNLITMFFGIRTRRYIHVALSVIAVCLSIAGIVVVIVYRSAHQKPHFDSLHNNLGLAAAVFLVPTLVNGPITFVLQLLNKKIKPVYMRTYHVITSVFGLTIGMACLCTGYQKRWFRSQHSSEVVTSFIVLSSITIVLTLKTPIVNLISTIVGLVRSARLARTIQA